jgi:hypothetical protein
MLGHIKHEHFWLPLLQSVSAVFTLGRIVVFLRLVPAHKLKKVANRLLDLYLSLSPVSSEATKCSAYIVPLARMSARPWVLETAISTGPTSLETLANLARYSTVES